MKQGFVIEPMEGVVFQNVEVDHVYKKSIRLTNVGPSLKSFHLVPLPLEIRDLFHIHYNFPGFMSAGTSVTIHIEFTPKHNKDEHHSLQIITSTQETISFPLFWSFKKVQISTSIKNNLIDFGSVCLAEHKMIFIEVENKGALDTLFHCKGSAWEEYGYLNQKQMPSGIFLFSSQSVMVPAYSKSTLQISFYPKENQWVESELILEFEDSFTLPIHCRVIAQGIDAPIYLEQNIFDFHCIYYNTLYRNSFLIFNRGKTSMKIQIQCPKELNSFECNPSIAFVQANDKEGFLIQTKLQIKNDSIVKLFSQYVLPNSSIFEIPIQIVVPDQKLPVWFKIRFSVSQSVIFCEPNLLQFENCNLFETISMPVTISNPSLLSQYISLQCHTLSSEIVTIHPSHVHLLPKESQTVLIYFTPQQPIEYLFKIICKTDRSEESIISCMAQGIKPPLQLEHSILKLPTMATDELYTCQIVLQNQLQKDQEYCFVVPSELSVIKSMKPIKGIVAPQQSQSIVLQVKMPSIVEQSLQLIRIPCYIRNYSQKCIILQIEMSTVERELQIMNQQFPQQLLNEYSFDTVAVHQTKSITIQLLSKQSTQIILKKQNEQSPFTISMNHLECLEHVPQFVTISFCPIVKGAYHETISILSSNTSHHCYLHLSGEAKESELQFELSNLLYHLECSETMPNTTSTMEVTITNTSPQEIHVPFEMQIVHVHPCNYNSSSPFIVVPSRGIAKYNQKQNIRIEFRPDHYFDGYYRSILFLKYGQSTSHCKAIGIKSKCLNKGIFINFDSQYEHIMQMQKNKPHLFDREKILKFQTDTMPYETISLTTNTSENVNLLPQYEYAFSTAATVGGKLQMQFEIGFCCPIGDTKSKAEFTFSSSNSTLFTIEPAKGVLQPNSKSKITVTFAPTAQNMNQNNTIMIPNCPIFCESQFDVQFKDPFNSGASTKFKFNGEVVV